MEITLATESMKIALRFNIDEMPQTVQRETWDIILGKIKEMAAEMPPPLDNPTPKMSRKRQ